MEHIITAVFDPGRIRTVASEPLFQWDYGQTLVFSGLDLPTAYQVDFSNFEYCGNSIPQIGGADGVTVPVDVLTTGRDVYAFVWLQDADSGRTRYMAQIPVIPRPVPELDDPNPEQESAIAEAIAALNAGVAAAEAAQAAAEQSAEDAEQSAEDAEAWAVGERGGVPVEADDPTYENNAKYYAEQGGSGLSEMAISLLNTILSAAVYETDQTANIAALIAELSGGDVSGVIISFSGLSAIINNLQGTGISYSGKTAMIGGN